MGTQSSHPMGDAFAYWHGSQPLEAGKLIFASLPTASRARWAAGVLRTALAKSHINFTPIQQALHMAENPSEWRGAHRVFCDLRETTLELERTVSRSAEQELLLLHLYLAENTVKVVYNATEPSDPFDEDSGWWVAVCLKSIVDWWGDDQFSSAAWSALCFRE